MLNPALEGAIEQAAVVVQVQHGTKVRDASVDPRPVDFKPMRHPDGHPEALMHAEVGTREYYEAVAAERAAALELPSFIEPEATP